ncbi:MAG: hypothetical protein NT076_02455 [Candidatus Pacearchaeota archaeon]|nr:hypothetical protein [Candidatus Pacearchaeota archaeon]
MGYQRLMNSHEKTGFKVTPEFTLKMMNGIQQNQMIFDKNMASHLQVLDKIGNKVGEVADQSKKLGEIVESLAGEVKKLKEEKHD